MKRLAKSRINQHTFDDCNEIEVNGKRVVKAWIDGKRMYHIERRHPWEGYLVESTTVTSLNQLKAAL